MLGTRGVPARASCTPEIYEMQTRAIVRAARAVGERTGAEPHFDVMIPLVAYEGKLEIMRKLVEAGRRRGRASGSPCSRWGR